MRTVYGVGFERTLELWRREIAGARSVWNPTSRRAERDDNGAAMNLFEELTWRGMVQETTEGLSAALEREPVTAYIGFDPTAASLHVGSLMTMLNLARLQRAGHTPIALVGGGTGLIGDPSGRSQERNLLTFEQVEANARGIRAQLERVLDFEAAPNAARMANNIEWLRAIGFLDFLRDVGKHFTVNAMMAKESVKRRLAGDDGISFTEFSYQLLQAYDYLVLHDRHHCTLQMGGSDQWGNITAGCDLVRRTRGVRVHGLVWPLMTTAAGTKFGKTEAGTIWLDPSLTSPFAFYQFWWNTDDRDVVKYLKFFTWLDRETIASLEACVASAPEQREAQRTLAREVTTLVHGAAEAAGAERASAVLFASSLADATAADILRVFEDVPAIDLPRAALTDGVPTVEVVVRAGLAASKGEATRLIRQGGLYVNDERVQDERGRITLTAAIEGRVIVLRKGHRERRLVRVGLESGPQS
jgi:tyrosyl-tRNA synthetase